MDKITKMENKKNMVKASTFFSGNYITAEKLKDNKALLDELTILAVVPEKVQNEDKLMVVFDQKDEGLILNKTNYLKIKEILGDETDNWADAKITLTIGKTMFNGKLVPAVNILKVSK